MKEEGNFYQGHDIFFAAIEKTRMPIVLTDPNLPDNPIVFSNAAFEELTGYGMDDVLGRNCRFLQGADTDRSTVQQIKKAIENHDDLSVEILNYRKDGSQFWNALYISPVHDDEKKLKFFFASQLDITRRQSAEEALRQAQKMEAVGQLTGGIAHDFNNMLTVIQGNLEIALMRAAGQNSLMIPIERALKGAIHAGKLTEQLLSFARKQRLNSVTTNINDMVSTTIDILARTLGSNVEIDLDLDMSLRLVEVDVVQLNTAILNVVINARDAMVNGGEIKIRTFNEEILGDSQWEVNPGVFSVISFKDNGTGISPENLKRVTEPFFTTKDVGKGTGMGLAMVYGFLKQSGGHLGISSDSNGTEIRFYLPQSGKATAHTETIRQAFKEVPRFSHRLLVVEDNEQIMEMIKESVEEQGYEVRYASSATEALEIVKGGFEPQILCTDIVMPGLINGVELARELKSKDRDLRVLLCTGWADHFLDKDNEFPVLVKPYLPSQLVQKLAGLIQLGHEG